jgi:hypothetical protein
MRIVNRRDGTVVLQGENGDEDEVLASAALHTFSAIGSVPCDCDGPRPDVREGAEGPELYCLRCHRVLGRFALSVRAEHHF